MNREKRLNKNMIFLKRSRKLITHDDGKPVYIFLLFFTSKEKKERKKTEM